MDGVYVEQETERNSATAKYVSWPSHAWLLLSFFPFRLRHPLHPLCSLLSFYPLSDDKEPSSEASHNFAIAKNYLGEIKVQLEVYLAKKYCSASSAYCGLAFRYGRNKHFGLERRVTPDTPIIHALPPPLPVFHPTPQ